jgi:cellulose synthase operon protein C
MKKLLLILLPVLALVAISGGVWWKYGRNRDPFANAQLLIEKGDLQGALLELRNIVRLSPQNVTAHFRLGQVELQLGDAVAAEKDLRQARDMGFDARSVGMLLAEAYLAQNKYPELLREFSPQGLPPDQASRLDIMRAAAQLATGDSTGAQASAEEAERLTPQSVEALLNAARISLALHDATGSEQKVDRALAINPRAADALLLKGQLLNLKGDRIRAIEQFDAAIAARPNVIAARLERANALVASNEDAKARVDVDAALKLQPNSALAVYLQGVLLARAKDYAGADASFTKLGSLLAQFPRGFYFMAVTKYSEGQGEQATDAAAHYLAHNPNDPDAIKLAAKIELASRRYPHAIEILSRALDIGQADAEILDLLGRAYSLNGQPVQAVQTLQRAAALAPDNAEILTRLAAIRMGMGDVTGATSDLEHSLEVAPTGTGAGEALVTAALSSGDLDKAALALDRLKRQEGDSEAVGNLTGMIKMAQLDLDGARTVLSDVAKRFPDSVQTKLNLARVLVVQDKPKDAEQLLNAVLEHDPANVSALNALVPIVAADGRIQRAVALLETAHGAAPQNVGVTLALADLEIRTNDTKKALALVDQNLKEQSTNEALLAMRARLQLILGQSDGARDSYRQILDLDPGNVDIRHSLAELLLSVNDNDGAKALLADGVKATPGDSALMQYYVGIIARLDGLNAALAAADRLAADPANQPAARALKGDIYVAAGQFADAVTAYGAELRSNPTSALVLRNAAALGAAGRADQAAQGLRDWLAVHPDDADVAAALATLDIVAHRFYDAEAHLHVVLTKRPNDATSLNNLAWVYQQRNDPRARDIAQKAYLLSPSPQIADTLGWVLVSQGNAASALTLLRQAAVLQPDEPSVQYHLATALNATGQREQAVAVLRPIVLGPANFDEKQEAAHLLAELSKDTKAAPAAKAPTDPKAATDPKATADDDITKSN